MGSCQGSLHVKLGWGLPGTRNKGHRTEIVLSYLFAYSLVH